MNNYDNQDLEAFLIEAELINQKVKALAQNRLSPQQFDTLEAKRAEDRKRRQDAKLKKQREAYNKKVQGRSGKGITKDFSHFCRACHLEYQLDTPVCLKCNRRTMTLEQRQQQLQAMVEDYKYNKLNREQKKHKWQMFQKTQAAMWKKSSIDYNKKWDYFVEDSQQEPEQQPILPTNDPNFKALEMDIEQRKKRRKADTEKAKSLKDKGNAQMKKGDYQKAMEYYTLALQHIKDIKSVYTNRALAFIKLKRFKKAIKDCTNVIQYMEIFQKIGENKDLTFKAFSRRALAQKEIKQYKPALDDINEALKLIPGDSGALLMKKQIEGFIQHNQTVQKIINQSRSKEAQAQENKSKEISEENKNTDEGDDSEQEKEKSQKLQRQIIKELAEQQLNSQANMNQQNKIKKQSVVNKQEIKLQQDNPVKQIPKRLENLSEENVQYLLNLLIIKNQLKNIFIASKGIEKTLDFMFKQESPRKQALLLCLCLQGQGVAQKRVWDWGIYKFYQKIQQKFEQQAKLHQSLYDFIDNLFAILVPITLYEPHRLQLSSSPKTYQFINKLFPKLITKYKKQAALVQNFILFISNLCSKESKLKNIFLNKDQVLTIVASLDCFLWKAPTKNRQLLDLRQTSLALVSNLLTNPQIRKAFVAKALEQGYFEQFRVDLETYPRNAHNFQTYIENILSLLVNASLQTQLQAPLLGQTLMNRFISSYDKFSPTIVYRSLLAVSRLKFTQNSHLAQWMKVFDKMSAKLDPLANAQQKNIAQIVKILNVMFALEGPLKAPAIPQKLYGHLSRYVKDNMVHEILFCNTGNLLGIMLEKGGETREQALKILRSSIGRLVDIAKDKVGNWRKSAAILLGKSSSDPQCRAQLDKHHGMDVLKSIASFVIDKK